LFAIIGASGVEVRVLYEILWAMLFWILVWERRKKTRVKFFGILSDGVPLFIKHISQSQPQKQIRQQYIVKSETSC
jgi:hypothetical protein